MFQINFIFNNVIHSIDIKKSTTDKLASESSVIIQSYHFSIDQVFDQNIKNDSGNCFDCPFSFNQNNGLSGGCYTHEKTIFLGLCAKLKRLNKLLLSGNIPNYSNEIIEQIKNKSKKYNIDLLRLGTYGEAVTMPIDFIAQLIPLSKKHTAYTHLWHLEQYSEYKAYFMASTDNFLLSKIAKSKNWRVFEVGENIDSIQCPSDPIIKKENRINCAKCGLCSGNKLGAKSIYINYHGKKQKEA
jgi:hypothetical protein